MAEIVQTSIENHFNYWIYVILMMIGLWAVIAKNNWIKKLIGLSIFQTAIILLYVSLGAKTDASIPILEPYKSEKPAESAVTQVEGEYGKSQGDEKHDDGGEKKAYAKPKVDPDTIVNPLPHVLMLTAIVVGVATLGVALSLSQRVYKEFGTLEEDELLEKLRGGESDG